MKSASTQLLFKNPELPVAYDLVFHEQVESIRTTAIELANQGCEEGALTWVLHQTHAKARLNKNWKCNAGDLHCAVILQPDFEPEKYQQILVVAMVSLGNAIAANVSAMTALGYNWPNDISIANHKIASVWLDQGKSEKSDWLIVSLSVNVENGPQDQDFDAMCIQHAQAVGDVTNSVLLEAFAREFIKQLNLWDERGFEYIYKQWKIRLQNLSAKIELETPKNIYSGISKGINADGSLVLHSQEESETVVSISEYMELDQC